MVALEHAQAYLDSGLSLVPITAKSKWPPVKWEAYQQRQPTAAELQRWVSQYPGLGIVGGKVSGNLEILDLESIAPLAEFFARVEAAAPGLLARLPLVGTPTDGRHLYYRCEKIEGNQKLAQRAVEVTDAELPRLDSSGALDKKAIQKLGLRQIEGKHYKIKTLIETRGEGGQVLSPLCLSGVHPSGGVYRLIHGDLCAIPTITPAEREILLTAARACNEFVDPKDAKGRREASQQKVDGLKPGEDFNQRSDVRGKVVTLLENHGWSRFGKGTVGELWSRSGVSDHCSATLFDNGTLYVFSTNAAPLNGNEAYSPFALLAELEHNGDFQAAAKVLAAQGYGEQRKKQQQPVSAGEPQITSSSIYDDDAASQYKANGVGLVWLKWVRERGDDKPRQVPVQLTNFVAEITADISRDDGAEQTRLYDLRARLAGEQAWRSVTINASDFATLQKWTHEVLGAKAVVFPGKGEHAKVAIQMLSQEIQTRRVVAHTGWRDDDGAWLYYHTGGAIGADGLVDAEVSLPAALEPVLLPAPPTDARRREVIRTIAFDLPRVAPESITLPTIGGAWAAAITNPDFSLFLIGYTGSGKSELAALVQAFFGAGFHAENLPGAWSSSANSLEALAHTGKDCIVTIDDFCPIGSTADQARMHAAADRVLRAQGNPSGRGRCRADGSLRPSKPPRGLIICTGEDLPRGQSLRARTGIVQVEKTAVDWRQLTICQRQARGGMYAEAMSAFLQWLAAGDRIARLRAGANEAISRLRDQWIARGEDGHKRSASTLAQLQWAWQVWLEFAADCGALDSDEVSGLREAVELSLDAFGRAQGGYQTSESPAPRFIELIQAALSSGKGHLATLDGGRPDNCKSWGWREDDVEAGQYRSQGNRIGWIEGDNVYLQPDAAYKMAQTMGVNGEGLTVSSQTLWKRLFEAGLLASRDEKRDTHKVRRKVEGKTVGLIHMRAEKLADYSGFHLNKKSRQASISLWLLIL